MPSKMFLWLSRLLFRVLKLGAALPPRTIDAPPLGTFSHGFGDGERDRSARPNRGLEGNDLAVSVSNARPRTAGPLGGEMFCGGVPLFQSSLIPFPTRFLMRRKAFDESSESSPVVSSGDAEPSSLPKIGDR
jgi:hypothetical protein